MTSRYVVRRLLQVLPAVGGILTLSFLLIHLAPGDPAVALAGESGDPGSYALIREKFGLDKPLPEQLAIYAGTILRGDLGTSFIHGRPVASVIGERVPATMLLMLSALALSSVVGVALGSAAARRPFGGFDFALSTTALVGYCTPSFWLAQVSLLTLAFSAGLFPIQGMTDARAGYTGLAHAFDVARHLALPAMVLAASEVALIARLTRTGLLEAMGQEYVRTAHAKGVSDRAVLLRHALPNALLPVVTIIGGRIGFLFSGAVLVEIVFAWPGLGRLLLSSVQTRDYPVLLGLFLMVAFSVVLANLLTDLLYARIDPRIRYE